MALADVFWSHVWQCTHKHPCKKCCWPWRAIDVSLNWQYVWHLHATVPDPALARHVTAYRYAYELTHGRLLPWGQPLALCHQCHFRPCCNPTHVVPGSPSDNGTDRLRARQHRTLVLPDGRSWTYRDACVAQDAFNEARSYCRVFAGPIAAGFLWMEADLAAPTFDTRYADRFPAFFRALYHAHTALHLRYALHPHGYRDSLQRTVAQGAALLLA